MLNNTTTTKLHEMKLSAMATAFRHQSETDGFSELSFEERFGLLVDAEWTSRRNNRLTRLLKKAGFSEPGACLEDIEYHAVFGKMKVSQKVSKKLAPQMA